MEKRPQSILFLGWVVGALYLLRAGVQLFPYELAVDTLSASSSPEVRGVAVLVVLGVSIGSLALLGLAPLSFFVWSYRAHENARLLAPYAPLSNGPGVMIWSYFIPFANLFLPYSAMREVYVASDTAARDEKGVEYELDSKGATLWLFTWIFFLTTNIVVSVTTLDEQRSMSDETTTIMVQAPFLILTAVLTLAWCVTLSRLQERAIARQLSRAP